MTSEEKKRMIHIRISDEIHKELRKAAAEYDLTIQEIVSDAVEERVEAFEEVLVAEAEKQAALREELLAEAERQQAERNLKDGGEPVEVRIEHEMSVPGVEGEFRTSVILGLEELRRELEALRSEVAQIHRELSGE